jgi:hypothetical protein
MRAVAIVAVMGLTACVSSGQFAKDRITKIYVADVEGDPQILCDAGEVSLGHAESVSFFKRATVIDYRSFDDNYPYTTCRVLGTLQYDGKPCNWWISVAGTAVVTCNGHETYFACDTCKDLFKETCSAQPSTPCESQ